MSRMSRMSIIGGGDESSSSSSSSFRTSSSSSSSSSSHQVFRGMSPTTASRLENRVKELEEALEQERSAHLRTEKELTEIRFSFESVRERLDESEAETSVQVELVRRKDLDFLKVKKDLDLLTAERESSEASLKKRFQEQINELTEQLERANKLRSKLEKEKQTIVIEIETYTSQLDAANKAKSSAESKLTEQEESLRKLKAQNDDLTRANLDLTSVKSRLTQEVSDLQRHLQEVETNFGSSSKVKIQLQHQVDEVKAKYEEESRIRTQLEIQLNGLQDEVSGLKSALDEESEAANNFKGQAGKWQADFTQLKAKYDKDVVLITEEFEETRRKTTLRITELEAELEQQKARAARLDKEKSKLTIEINDLVVNLEAADGAANETAKRLKQAEHASAELQKHVDELTVEARTSGADRDRLQNEVSRLKQLADDLQSKLDALTREHAKLHETLKESEASVRDLTRQSAEWSTLRLELIAERDALNGQLGGAHDALNDLQGRLDSANSALNQGKADLEARIREKDDEIENVRRASQRSVEELQRSLVELESRSKSEVSRLKKKYESEIQEITLQIDVLNRASAELNKNNKSLANKLKETELSLEAERRIAQEARDSGTAAEKRASSLLIEIEDLRLKYDSAEKARKHLESELHDSSSRLTEINITITTLTADKRRLESDLATSARDREEAAAARRSAEERAEKLSSELSRTNEMLRAEKETSTRLETVRHQLEVSIKEYTLRIEQIESSKDGKKGLAKLQTRINELEQEVDVITRRERDVTAENAKLKRQLQELRSQSESDHRLIIEYTETINILETKYITIKRQFEQSEEVLNITMAKYRKTQALLEEAERRADRAENNVTIVRRQSVNVTRGAGGSVTTRSVSSTRDSRHIR